MRHTVLLTASRCQYKMTVRRCPPRNETTLLRPKKRGPRPTLTGLVGVLELPKRGSPPSEKVTALPLLYFARRLRGPGGEPGLDAVRTHPHSRRLEALPTLFPSSPAPR